MKKLIKWLDSLIIKFHKCENNLRVFSYTFEEMHGTKVLTKIEYKCTICEKIY